MWAVWLLGLGCDDEGIEYRLVTEDWAWLNDPGEPDIRVTPCDYDFGAVPIGESAEVKMKIEEVGGGSLALGGITTEEPDGPYFLDPVGSVLLPSGSRTSFVVHFAPEPGTPVQARLRNYLYIDSNDPDEPRVYCKLSGQAAPAEDDPR